LPQLSLFLSLSLAASLFATSACAQPDPTFEDTIAQRVLACTGCHGKEGRAAPDGYYPRIAGKPAGYLYNQLLNFREGRRHYALMTAMVDPLSDAYLREIAAYFAALELPYPQPPAAKLPPAIEQRGRRLALEGDASRDVPACVQCHGTAMTGVAPAIPGLLGLPRDYVNAQLGAWRNGNRRAQKPDCMAQVAQRLSPEDIGAVSQWLAAQPVPQAGKPAERLPGALPMPCGGMPASGSAALDATPAGEPGRPAAEPARSAAGRSAGTAGSPAPAASATTGARP
jgi:cytochrome c553